jgi:hypothetical protein
MFIASHSPELSSAMEANQTPIDQLSQHLHQLEAREKKRRTWRWTVLVITLLTVGTVSATLVEPTQRQYHRRRLVAADTLSPQSVAVLFRQSMVPLVVAHQAMDTVLISNLDEYHQYSLQLAERIPPEVPAIDVQPDFVVTIRGAKRVGRALTFEVSPFDSSYQLTLDLGNGITRSLRQSQLSYAYPLAGHFEMRLLLTTETGSKVLQTLKYQILPAASVDATAQATPSALALRQESQLAIQPIPQRPFELDVPIDHLR